MNGDYHQSVTRCCLATATARGLRLRSNLLHLNQIGLAGAETGAPHGHQQPIPWYDLFLHQQTERLRRAPWAGV